MPLCLSIFQYLIKKQMQLLKLTPLVVCWKIRNFYNNTAKPVSMAVY